MRLLALPFVLAAAAIPVVELPAPPRPLVILVHGRGQLGSDSATMRKDWKRDLDSALAREGLPTLRDEDVRLAWYADVLDPNVEAACDAAPVSEAGLGSLARGFLVSLVSVMPDSGAPADRSARSIIGDMLYLVDPGTRCAARTRFRSLLASARTEQRPVIVVAYSLGAAVAYEALNRAVADPAPAVHLVTLGSPLGAPVARELLTGALEPLRVPRGVQRWVNVYDPDDAFSAPLELSEAVTDVRTAQAARGDAHEAGRYLRDPATAAAVGRSLCDLSSGAYSARCQQRSAGGG